MSGTGLGFNTAGTGVNEETKATPRPTIRLPSTLSSHPTHSASAPDFATIPLDTPPPTTTFEYQYTKLPFYADFGIEIIMYRENQYANIDVENERIPLYFHNHKDKIMKSPRYLQRGFSLSTNLDDSSTEGIIDPCPYDLTEQYTTRYILNWEATQDVFARMTKGNGDEAQPQPTPYDMALFLREVNEEFKDRDQKRRENDEPTWDGYVVRHSEKISATKTIYRQICYSNTNFRLLDEELNDGSLIWTAAGIAQSCQGEQGKFYWENFRQTDISPYIKAFIKLFGASIAMLAAFKAGIGVYQFFNTTDHLMFSTGISLVFAAAGAIPAAIFYFDSIDKIFLDYAERLTHHPLYNRLILRFASKDMLTFPKKDLGILQLISNIYFGTAYAAGNFGMVMIQNLNDLIIPPWLILTGIAITNWCVGTVKADKFTSDVIAIKKALKNERNPALEIAFNRLETALGHLEKSLKLYCNSAIASTISKNTIYGYSEIYRRVLSDAFEANKDCTFINAVRLVREQMNVVQSEFDALQITDAHELMAFQLPATSAAMGAPLNPRINIKDCTRNSFLYQKRFDGDNGHLRPSSYYAAYGLSAFFSITGVLSNINGVNAVLTSKHINMPAPYALTLSIISVVSAVGLNKGSFDQIADWLLLKLGHRKLSAQFKARTEGLANTSCLVTIGRYAPFVFGHILSMIQATCGFYYTYSANIFDQDTRIVCAVATFLSMWATKSEKCIDFFKRFGTIFDYLLSFFPCMTQKTPTVHINQITTQFLDTDNKMLLAGISKLVTYINSRLREKDIVKGRAKDVWKYYYAAKTRLSLTSVIDIEDQKKLGVYPYEIRSDGTHLSFVERLEEALEQITLKYEQPIDGHTEVRTEINQLLERELAALSLCSLMLDNGKELLKEGQLQCVPFSPTTHEPQNPPSVIQERHNAILALYNFALYKGKNMRRRRPPSSANAPDSTYNSPFFNAHDHERSQRLQKLYAEGMGDDRSAEYVNVSPV